MHNKYNEKISDMKKCIQKKNKLNLLLKQTEQDIIKEKLLLNKLSGELEKEYQDALKLKSDNIISLFYEILGTEEDKHNKEKQKLLKARLKYEQCKNNMNYLVNETKKIVDCIEKLNGCDAEYEELINKKIETINIEDNETGQALKKLIKRKENMNANIIEICEAICYGEKALEAIEMTIKELEAAENFENSDGSNNIENARGYAEQTHRMLGRFKKELSDITIVTGTEIAVGTFENFADCFFDNLIFDWVVQSGIRKSLDTVKNTKNQLDKAMSKLYEEKVTEEFMIKQIEEQINQIIEKV
ncbi:MAG TPA: hypothetical protein PK516_04630 [Sedimentibacter sp.]|jgi:hypothetical protein|nr:hypothetical protein [Sedimentibacter sp.]NLA12629.1 hypothetical protein [Tissierellia bacterium]HAS92392.1 hypothetical protein [Clostridiales bacterium]HOA20208.1 hypothetical protein [Sedimentibacter sp.]HOG62579.1 hypothetical protein [Sedimentibacter sp.]